MQKQTDSYSFAQISPLGAHDYVALFGVSLNLANWPKCFYGNICRVPNVHWTTQGILGIVVQTSADVSGCETWKMTQNEENKLDVFQFQFKCFRRILRIRWPVKMRNE